MISTVCVESDMVGSVPVVGARSFGQPLWVQWLHETDGQCELDHRAPARPAPGGDAPAVRDHDRPADRETEAHPAVPPRRALAAVEFLEDLFEVVFGNA